MDETLAIPTEKAAQIALRTQQLIAYETGLANVVDPLGGSWYVESLTDKMEEEAEKYFLKIDELGGVVPAIEDGYFQREIAKAASDYQRKVDSKERVVVGVNEFVNKNEEIEIPILTISGNAQKQQSYNLKKMRESRDTKILQKSLDEVTQACKNGNNLMPPIINAARSLATLGEIVRAMKPHFGEWVEGSVF